MRWLGRALLLVIGLGVAVPVGFLAILVGVAVDPAARDLLGALGLAGVEAVASALADGFPPDADAFSPFAELWAGLMILLVAPPSFAALVGEVAEWRSFAWYGGAAGALAAALPWLARSRIPETVLPAEGRITALLFLSGAASGLAYWLVAGRGAGRPSPPAARPAAPSRADGRSEGP